MSIKLFVPVALFCTVGGCAQSNLNQVAVFSGRPANTQTECNLTARPDRVREAVARQGHRVDDFLPRQKYHALVRDELERQPAVPRIGGRATFCAQLAEKVRSSPLNTPHKGDVARQSIIGERACRRFPASEWELQARAGRGRDRTARSRLSDLHAREPHWRNPIHADDTRGCLGQIDYAAANEWASVIDPHHHGAACIHVDDTHA
jgi:hypothetical protein